jgi:hypothetical protein
MTATKIVKTNVTDEQLVAAQGGINGNEHEVLWVDCPADYNVDRITATDIVHDNQIRVVPEPAPEPAKVTNAPTDPTDDDLELGR